MIYKTLELDPSTLTIGTTCMAEALACEALEKYSSGFVISQDNVYKHHGSRLEAALAHAPWKPHVHLVPDGESIKNLNQFGSLLHWLADNKADRHGVVLVLGGGVVGDLSGFVAAAYMRGVDWIYIPTTLLAQQDASIGGKVAVNLPHGKNLVGHFYPPKHVIIDSSVLGTLPEREAHAGYMEFLKHGMLRSPELFHEVAAVSLPYDYDALVPLMTEALMVKVDIVREDPYEKTGKRRLLNLGHTLAHAIETYTDYKLLLHGEAVGLGLLFVAHLARELGHDYDWAPLERAVLERMPPLDVTCWDRDRLFELTKLDKKGKGGKIPWILPLEPGKIEVIVDPPEAAMMRAFDVWHQLLTNSRKP